MTTEARCSGPDAEVFDAFVRGNRDRVFRIALRWMGSVEDAQDLTQDVFLTLSRKMHLFEGQSRLSTWLYRVTVNHAKNRLRYHARRRARAHEPLEERHRSASSIQELQSFAGPHEVYLARELSERLEEALEGLSPIHRQIFIWRDIDGLSYEAIGKRLELPEGTVKSRLHRARSALRTLLEGEGTLSAREANPSPAHSRAR